MTTQPCARLARRRFCDGTQNPWSGAAEITGARSTSSPRSRYSHSRPSSSGLTVNAGQRSGSLPTSGSTRIWGPPGSGLPGFPWYTESSTIACRSLTQPSSAPSRGTGMPSAITWWTAAGTWSTGRISWYVNPPGWPDPAGSPACPHAQGLSTKCSAVS
jgi:hypothetical protein